MKILLILLSLVFCTANAEAKKTAEVAAVLDALHVAASKADGQVYFNLFTQDAIFIGTDVSEMWTIDEFKAFAIPLFTKGQGWAYFPRSRDIRFSASGEVAWFHEVLDNKNYGTTRGTGVLVLEQGKGWRIAQYHLTIPIPNNIAGNVTQIIKAYEAKTAGEPDK